MPQPSSPNLPRWLPALLQEKFFNACLVHEYAKKNEKNILCLDCCFSICPHCLPHHRSHRLLQIRRYVYHDVLRLEDAKKLIDCASVQGYTNNSAKVVFLNQRPPARPCRGSGNVCSTCDRALQDPFLFCSLSCKIHHLVRNQGVGGLSKHLHDGDCLPLPDAGRECFSELEEGQMTPDSVLEPARSSSESGVSGGGGVWCQTLACTAATGFVRRKRSGLPVHRAASCRPFCSSPAAATGSRRKGTPHRAPLY